MPSNILSAPAQVALPEGINYGFANTKAYVLTRDGYTCPTVQGESKDRRLEVHHIIFRSQNGSDAEANLVTLVEDLHDALHAGRLRSSDQARRGGRFRTRLR